MSEVKNSKAPINIRGVPLVFELSKVSREIDFETIKLIIIEYINTKGNIPLKLNPFKSLRIKNEAVDIIIKITMSLGDNFTKVKKATEKNICAKEKHRSPLIKDLFSPWPMSIGKARNISPNNENINAISRYVK